MAWRLWAVVLTIAYMTLEGAMDTNAPRAPGLCHKAAAPTQRLREFGEQFRVHTAGIWSFSSMESCNADSSFAMRSCKAARDGSKRRAAVHGSEERAHAANRRQSLWRGNDPPACARLPRPLFKSFYKRDRKLRVRTARTKTRILAWTGHSCGASGEVYEPRTALQFAHVFCLSAHARAPTSRRL